MAEVRLSAELPQQRLTIYDGGVLAIACPDVGLKQILAWKTMPRQDLDWAHLEVKAASTLQIRVPKDVSGAKFELLRVE